MHVSMHALLLSCMHAASILGMLTFITYLVGTYMHTPMY